MLTITHMSVPPARGQHGRFPVCSVQSIAVPPATNSLLINIQTLDAMTFFVLPGSPDSDTYHTTLIFDFSTACWTRAPVPQPNTAIQCYGLCHELGPTGTLRLKVDSTALNISTSGSAPSDDTSGSPGSTASAPGVYVPPFHPQQGMPGSNLSTAIQSV
ncbi:hypothetical protein B0H13DRAFT_2268030 [Mycena leptocephala]|nr:hypothetical protein B0H13DRAFT_2268030 [Mycena leptocephala]